MSDKREGVDFLEDAVGAMEKAERFVTDMSAVIRAIEIVGEAAKRIPSDVRSRFSDRLSFFVTKTGQIMTRPGKFLINPPCPEGIHDSRKWISNVRLRAIELSDKLFIWF